MASSNNDVATKTNISSSHIIPLDSNGCQDAGITGGKGFNLAKLVHIGGVKSKPGYIISSTVYAEQVIPKIKPLLTALTDSNVEQRFEEIREIISNIELPSIATLQPQVLNVGKYYAVRSSATVEDSENLSFSGKFESYLYIQNEENINIAIKRVWLSIFTLNNYQYCQENHISFADIAMAVVIQEMSCPIAAGIVFANTNQVEIDCAFGLGEAVVRGDTPTDKIVLKPSGEIIFTEISAKKDKLIYSAEEKKIITQPLEYFQRNSLCMTYPEIEELHTQVKLIQNHYKECAFGVDIEFSVDEDGYVYILQVRPVTTPISANALRVDYQTVKSSYIGGGLPVSYHIGQGRLALCETPADAEKAIDKNKKNGEKTILVVPNTTSQWESVMRKADGIIAETGSSNCHTAIACREMRISGVTEYVDAMSHLQPFQGETVTLCGTSGKLYRGDFTGKKFLVDGQPTTTYTPLESEVSLSKEKHLKMASAAGMVVLHQEQWCIGKPITPTCQLVNELDLAAHHWIGDNILSISKSRFHITDNCVLLMNFDDCHAWRELIRGWDIEFHKNILQLRKNAEQEFLSASESLILTEGSVTQWFDAYQKKIGFDNIAFSIGEILTGILHDFSKERNVTEPILSDLIPAQVAMFGHFILEEYQEQLRIIQSVLKQNKEAYALVKRLESIYGNENDVNYLEMTDCESRLIYLLEELNIYAQCKSVATSYRIQEKDFALTFLEPWFQQSSMPWLRLLITSKKLTGTIPQSVSKRKKIYYPDDAPFREMIELVAMSKKLHMDGHHTKARGMWRFIGVLKQLSQNTGYPIDELLSQPKEKILSIICEMSQLTRPGLSERQFSRVAHRKFQDYESNRKALNEQSIMLFCDSLPSTESLSDIGYAYTGKRIVFTPNNQDLSKELEQFEDQMSDGQNVIPPGRYRGEYVRPNRLDYTQHQIAITPERVITAVHLEQGKSQLRVGNVSIGKENFYSAPYKWENPALSISDRTVTNHEHYDCIEKYSQIIDEYIGGGFLEKTLAQKIQLLSKFQNENQSNFFRVCLNTNSKSHYLEFNKIVKVLLEKLIHEQHVLAILGQSPNIIYGYDGCVPAMQPVVRIPSHKQHELFLENALYFINSKLAHLNKPSINRDELFSMDKEELSRYLIDLDMHNDHFLEALISARKFSEYSRKPKLRARLDENTVVEVSMNDSIDIPSQALMMISHQKTVTDTNRQVHLATGYKAFSTLLYRRYEGRHQDIVLAKLAYTQASSTQSMSHFHIVPIYNSEGTFMIPYVDEDENFESFNQCNIENVQIAYSKRELQEGYFNLVKLRFSLNSSEHENMRTFELIDRQLQAWEMQTGCDVTWVAKFNSESKVVTLCIELRAGINQYTQDQIDAFIERGLWNKIGFTEVMGKKYSMLSQRNIEDATAIYENPHFAKLKQKMLATQLYSVQVSPEGKKTFYKFQDECLISQNKQEQSFQDIIHIARILQMYDAEQYTQTMSFMYKINEKELRQFKQLFSQPVFNSANALDENSGHSLATLAVRAF